METIILFAPLVGALICGFGWRIIGEKAAQWVATGFLFLVCLLSWIIFLTFDPFAHEGGHYTVQVLRWIESGSLATDWAIRMDRLTAIMLVVITSVSALVHLYSFGYMAHDDNFDDEKESYRPRFFAYLSLFPQLVAGPIVRARDLLPQLTSFKPLSEQQRWDGLKLIVFGFFKKVVVADTLAIAVNTAFGASNLTESCSYWWIVMIMFAYQIYCDFSGYSDIARGLGKWMGYEFPVNFRNPYNASSFREFWQRWHISLSTWFRDYVYIPLGGSRKGKVYGYAAMWFTMLISGLWHGAAWHFIVWAALHAFYLSIERMTHWPKKLAELPGGRHLATLTVFMLTVLAWVFFRAETFSQAMSVFRIMLNPSILNYVVADSIIDNNEVNVLLIILGCQLFYYFGWDKSNWATSTSRASAVFESVFLAILILTCVFMRAPSNTFIYFQF